MADQPTIKTCLGKIIGSQFLYLELRCKQIIRINGNLFCIRFSTNEIEKNMLASLKEWRSKVARASSNRHRLSILLVVFFQYWRLTEIAKLRLQ
jgi:hypothetical protein